MFPSRKKREGRVRRRRLRNARGPLLLGLWAFGPPIVVQEDEEGRVEISIGVAAGQAELVARSCSGDLLSADPVPFQSYGAAIEYEPGPFRVAAFGGLTSADAGAADGRYFGALLAFEGDGVGIGFGPVWLPGDETYLSSYLRFGSRRGAFVQTDLFAPGPTPGVTGLARLGLGFPIGRARGFAGFSTGRSLQLEDGFDNGGPFAEFEIPLGAGFGAQLGGSWFFSERHADWALGAAMSLKPR